MSQQRLALALGQAGQGLRHRGLLLLRQQLLVGRFGRAQVHHAVLVALLAVGVAPHGRDDVPRRHDGVGLEHAGLDPSGRGEDPGQGLLHQVIGGRVLPDAGTHNAPHHRDQARHIRLFPWLRSDVFLGSGATSADRASLTAGNSTPGPRHAPRRAASSFVGHAQSLAYPTDPRRDPCRPQSPHAAYAA